MEPTTIGKLRYLFRRPRFPIICAVGDNLKFTPGVAAKLFTAVGDVNIHMISQGSSEINVTFVVEDDAVETVARRLHEQFFSDLDSTVFG